MKQTRTLMGMPITIRIEDSFATKKDFDDIYKYFDHIDKKFSTYKSNSEIMQINRGTIKPYHYSAEMKMIFALAQETKQQTNGYFNIQRADGSLEPAGLVKGWAIWQASNLLKQKGFQDFYVDAGGDIQVSGKEWTVGIRNPFHTKQIIKAITIQDKGIATSGTYIRGNHIYNPHNRKSISQEIVSMTVIGPNIYEADRFATAAFAMGKKGISFINTLTDFAGYMIDAKGIATYTQSFTQYIP